MSLESYEGLYGYGYKDEKGNLYLPVSECLLLIREDNRNETYNAILINEYSNEGPLGVCLDENMSLRQWRKLYIESRTGRGIERFEKLLEKVEWEEENQAD